MASVGDLVYRLDLPHKVGKLVSYEVLVHIDFIDSYAIITKEQFDRDYVVVYGL